MRRFFLRTFIAIIVLVALLLLAIQIVLWTDLPRKFVHSAIQENLQLRVGMDSFDTGWGGRTSLGGVTLALPLADKSFLQTPRLAVRHTSLWGLLVGRGLKVQSIEIDKPNVLVLQGEDGRWNVEEVAELLRRATGGKTAEKQPQQTGVPDLPNVTITEGVIRIINRFGAQANISPLSIKGWSEGPLVWKFDVSVPDRMHVWGEVAPGGQWAHQADIVLGDLGPLAKPFLRTPSPELQQALKSMKFDARWEGRADRGVSGRLSLRDFYFAGWGATGPITAAFGGAAPSISPAGLEIRSPIKTIPPARAGGGSITFADGTVAAQGLTLAFAGGEVRLAGSYAFARGSGKAELWWNKLVLPADTVHGGSLTASLRQPWPGQPVIETTLTSDGTRAGGDSWSLKAVLSGAGATWQSIDWKLDTPRLVYHQKKQAFDLSNLAATLSTRGNLVELTSLSIPPGGLYGNMARGKLTGRGRYDLSTREWYGFISGADWPLARGDDQPGGKNDIDLDFHVDAEGGRTWLELRELFLEAGGMQVWANGGVGSLQHGLPASLNVYAWYPPVEYQWHERGGRPEDDIRLGGKLYSDLHLWGSAWPVDLEINGTLYAREFRVNDHPLGRVTVFMNGFADTENVRVRTGDVELLGGTWDLMADHRYEKRLTELTRVTLELKHLPLAQVDNFAKPPPNIRGDMSGRWVVKVPDFDIKRMALEGEYAIRNLSRVKEKEAPATQAATTRPETLKQVTPGEKLAPIADSVTGGITAENGIVTLAPIRFEYAAGRDKAVKGQGTALVSFPIDSPRQAHVEASVASWPLMLADPQTGRTGEVILWGGLNLDIDLKRVGARGPANATLSIAWDDKTVGTVKFDTLLDGRVVHVKEIGGDVLGGSIYGGGVVNLEKPLESRGRFDWDAIEAPRIVGLLPALEGLEGRYTGTVSFSPTPGQQFPEAKGPFGVMGAVRSEAGALHGMQIGDADFVAYLDHDRAVLDRLNWKLADGLVNAWARMTWYPSKLTGKPEPFLHVNLEAEKLSIDQVVRAARPRDIPDERMPGLVTAHLWVAGFPFTDQGRRTSSGEGRIRVEQSDLVNVDVVTALYNVLSVQIGEQEPHGRGASNFRLEGERLEITSVRYFNRGVELRASATVADVFKGAESPIQGTAAGSIRPLRDLKLPFAADVDQVFRALQQNMALVQIGGLVKKPDIKVIPFAEAGAAFKRFLAGEVQEETRGGGGR